MSHRILVTATALAFTTLLCHGCTDMPAQSTATLAVAGGTPSILDGVVVLRSSQGATCGAVVVGTRHVLTVERCADVGETEILVGASASAPDLIAQSVEVISGPLLLDDEVTVRAVLLVSDRDLPVTPVVLAQRDPETDELLTVIGHGTTTEAGGRTEGTILVDLTDSGTFMGIGQGDVEYCSGDAGAFDSDYAYAGIPVFGIDTTGSCLDPVVYAGVSLFGVFVNDNLPPAAAPDAGAGSTDAGDSSQDNGGGCSIGGARWSPAGLVTLLAALFVTTRGRSR